MTDLSELALEELCHTVRDILAKVAPLPMAHFRTALAVDAKADASPVTIADRQTETALRDHLSLHFPEYGILGEEFGTNRLDAEFVWVVDPIDGTRSFVTGHPMWGMLMGLLHRGKPILGAVQMPALSEIAIGAPGLGAWLGTKPLHVASTCPLEHAQICANELPHMLRAAPDAAARLVAAVPNLRATADCYSYVQLAAGWVDGVVDCNLQPYDYLPVLPLIEAAGGIMTDWAGNSLHLGSDGRVVAAANATLHADLLALLNADA